MTLQELYTFVDSVAPFNTQADFDNSGLQLGDPSMQVKGVHFALDITDAVLDEAGSVGANVIITHHPLIFSPVRSITENDLTGHLLRRLIKSDFGLICAHTNLDQAAGGTSETLGTVAGLVDIEGAGYLRVGNLTKAFTAAQYADFLSEQLHTTVRLMGPGSAVLHRAGVCAGAGSQFWQEAKAAGADAYVSGEIKHHHALAAAAAHVTCFECGHHATEEPGIFALADTLQNHANHVEWNLRITKSQLGAYAVRL